jgi:hypothetical protein
MQCPLCSGPANDITPTDFDGEIIHCPLCGDYEIAGNVQGRFTRSALEDRRSAWRKSFLGPAMRPRITSACF